MAYTLPSLPYSFDALEPHIDARTMEIHHDKHHAAYVANVNKALEGSPLAELPIEKLIGDLEQVPEQFAVLYEIMVVDMPTIHFSGSPWEVIKVVSRRENLGRQLLQFLGVIQIFRMLFQKQQ